MFAQSHHCSSCAVGEGHSTSGGGAVDAVGNGSVERTVYLGFIRSVGTCLHSGDELSPFGKGGSVDEIRAVNVIATVESDHGQSTGHILVDNKRNVGVIVAVHRHVFAAHAHHGPLAFEFGGG